MEIKNKAGVLENKKIFSQYIPLSNTLRLFLELPDCFETIYSYYSELKKNDGIIFNVVQTEFWKERSSQSNNLTFPLILYQDDFETGNPLGSHSGVHKICALYSTLPCIPPEFRSQVEKIFLVQLCHSDDVKFFGQDVVYREVITELNLLASKGIEIHVKDKTITVCFQLILITGDNLGLNSMLGYVESFSATYFCRMCKVSKGVSMSLCVEDKSILRTKDNYEADVAKNNVALTGIKTRCIWNSVLNYHCAACWSVDAMHDELEGSCKYETASTLHYFILVKKYFTLEELNFRIKYFKFPSTANVPPLITLENLKVKQLRMSASEMKCFIMHLGLLIGDLIPQENNPHWELHKLLRQIVSISLQTFISSEYIDLLTSLIEEHHLLYLSLFGNTLKPKHHFMLHYPTVMQRIGPLRHIWSMRGEAKHQILKQIASMSASRVNICRTIAIKSQLQFGNMLLLGNPFAVNITYRPLKTHLPISTNLTKYVSENLISYTQVKSASLASFMLKSGIILEIDFDIFPIFGLIEHVFCKSGALAKPSRDDFAIIVKVFHVVCQNDHKQSYEVYETLTHEFIKIDSTKFLKPTLMVTGSNRELYVPFH
ncbi:uncharacterized protein LOC124301549 [Neodiprion virginianus]|uniref:uncharacterized protein LOC124301549 n=1 Tax=Neodiprion virginianus TaxID=2961670 RepID=UPI001EE6B3DC|nr:uncharacterized protein LOC124301549 [Neodiprion virginianus]